MAVVATRPTLDPVTGLPRSEYACTFCKRRKVKCDRSLPFCSICQRNQQECKYPLEVARPGPKIGTTSRKRARDHSPGRRTSGPSATAAGPGIVCRRPSKDVDVINNSSNNNLALNLATGVHAGLDLDVGASPIGSNGIGAEAYPLTPVTTPLDVRTLAYIMHPSHDVAALDVSEDGLFANVDLVGEVNGDFGKLEIINHACSILGISMQALQKHINLFFENMPAFSLFHQPSFGAKLKSVSSATQLVALLASILSFSARFASGPEQGSSGQQHENYNNSPDFSQPTLFFERLSQQYVDEAFKEYANEAPPICLLQALILLTFQELVKGVCGSAWRRLGVCIRAAYELDLHHVDRDNVSTQPPPNIWCEAEERRRAWWAIWEMDVFASTIKRCPSGIDWTDNETFLPAADEHWFKQDFHPSCFLETKPIDRLKALQRCGNESTKAWFIVLNSLMREGHILSKYRSPRPGRGQHNPSHVSSKSATQDTTESLATLANALQCFSMALPKRLRYCDEYLSFSSHDPATAVTTRRMHRAKYSIHVMTQLARMMIHHQDAYCGAQQDLHLTGAADAEKQDLMIDDDSSPVSLRLGPTRKGLQQYIEAADELLHIVSRSSEEHARYVNPFFASTIWYGAAVHLAWNVLAPPRTNHDLIASKFEVMSMSLNAFTVFWDLAPALQKNLHSMEEKLKNFTLPKNRRSSSSASGTGGRPAYVGRVMSSTGNTRNSFWRADGLNPFSSTSAREIIATNTVITSTNDPEITRTAVSKANPMSFVETHRNQSAAAAATVMLSGNGEIDGAGPQPDSPPGSLVGAGSNSEFVFEGSWSADQDLDWQGEVPKALWDDLALDLDFAINPEGLFQGLTNSNRDRAGRGLG